MHDNLSSGELKSLVQSVFSPGKSDKNIAILVDIPDNAVPDNAEWIERREMAMDWYIKLNTLKNELRLDDVNLVLYPNVRSNNAELPETGYYCSQNDLKTMDTGKLKNSGQPVPFSDIFRNHQIFIALTELSATAPLKLSAKKYLFRAVTMPGFSVAMLPTLRLDYNEINNRIMSIKNILDPAEGLEIEFETPGEKIYNIYFDLRYRKATASGGRFPENGFAGNLPGGECYIVPYEGELSEPSRSSGLLPVQFEDEIVIYKIENNVALDVLSEGYYSGLEGQKIKDEPAYANIAEIGFGILNYFGIQPIGSILLDEKLGLHIAFGRSDHFGGAVGIKDFKNPENVIHIDRIYLPETQNKVTVNSVSIIQTGGKKEFIMKDGNYTIF